MSRPVEFTEKKLIDWPRTWWKRRVSQIGHNVLADAAHGVIGIINADSLENGQKEQRQAELRNQLPGHEGEDEGNILLNKRSSFDVSTARALPCHQNIIEQRQRQGCGRRLKNADKRKKQQREDQPGPVRPDEGIKPFKIVHEPRLCDVQPIN